LALKRGISASNSSKKLYRKMGQDSKGGSGEDKPGQKPSDAKPVDPRVARRRQDAIGRRLRQMYDDVVNENVPGDFMSFLEEADSNRSKPNGGGGPQPEPVTDGAESGGAASPRQKH
jgi:hypothetical protein